MIKKVAILGGQIAHIYHDEKELEMFSIEGAVIEECEMYFSEENGWREVGWRPEPTETEKLKADLEYLAIMTGVEL